MKLGFLGFGNLGKAIATRLSECGYDLYVWNRTPSKIESIKANTLSSPEAVVNECSMTFLCLFDSDAVETLLLGEKGILKTNCTDKIIIDFTTNSYKKVLNFHEECNKRNLYYLESPVLGSVVPARQGNLTILVSGKSEAFEKVKPVLESLGKHIFYLEKPGKATQMKLVNNLVLGSFMATIAESIATAEKLGISKEQAIEILSVGGGDSLVLRAKKEKILNEDFSTHFSNALIYKDINCLQEIAYDNKIPIFTASLIKELYASTFTQNFHEEDFSSIYKLFKNNLR
ncbi:MULTISPECIES: NAD(P)-dependent oxidoreductase [Calditerrivibrio]|uniref:NAD(P)-dependent oxidoreductase n=1 Tax=Calditerrivibrio TaxID=545865 RepID=UPI003C75D217